MREILFRGKPLGRLDEKGFIYGSLGVIDTDLVAIYQCNEFTEDIKCLVDIGTVGQYTGLTDKNGNKIFEGDILEFSDRLVIVFWHTHLGCWDSNFLKFTNKDNSRDDMSPLNWEYKSNVVGNIHDNPELLKGESNEAD